MAIAFPDFDTLEKIILIVVECTCYPTMRDEDLTTEMEELLRKKNDLQNRVKRGIEDSGGKKKGSNEVQGFFTDVDGFRRKGK